MISRPARRPTSNRSAGAGPTPGAPASRPPRWSRSPTRWPGPRPSTNLITSRTAQASASASSVGSRGSTGPGACRPHCSSTTARRGSCSARWASTHRRQAVSPGTTNGPTVNPPPAGVTTACARPSRTNGSSASRGSGPGDTRSTMPASRSSVRLTPAARSRRWADCRTSGAASTRTPLPVRAVEHVLRTGPRLREDRGGRGPVLAGGQGPVERGGIDQQPVLVQRLQAARGGRAVRRDRSAGRGRRRTGPPAVAGRAPRPGRSPAAGGRSRPAGAGRRGVRRAARAAAPAWPAGRRGRAGRPCPAPCHSGRGCRPAPPQAPGPPGRWSGNHRRRRRPVQDRATPPCGLVGAITPCRECG